MTCRPAHACAAISIVRAGKSPAERLERLVEVLRKAGEEDFLSAITTVLDVHTRDTADSWQPDRIIEIEDDRFAGGHFSFKAGVQSREDTLLHEHGVKVIDASQVGAPSSPGSRESRAP